MISWITRSTIRAIRRSVLPVYLLTAALAAPAQTAPTTAQSGQTSLTINVTGARNAKGKVIVWLFPDRQGFPNDTAKIVRQASVDIDPRSLAAHVTFRDLPPGNVAVTIFHYENGNGKMDKNFIGLPKEGVGASNNPKLMRAPKFDEAKVLLSGSEQAIEIKLGYIL